MTRLNQSDFERLLQLRTGLRRFLRWSEHQCEAAGLTPAQHQLLLAIRGHPGGGGPTIGEVADYLVLRHHSAVGLIDRAVAAGLVTRNPDPSGSTVRLALTPVGQDKLELLSDTHLHELEHLAPTMRALSLALHLTSHLPGRSDKPAQASGGVRRARGTGAGQLRAEPQPSREA